MTLGVRRWSGGQKRLQERVHTFDDEGWQRAFESLRARQFPITIRPFGGTQRRVTARSVDAALDALAHTSGRVETSRADTFQLSICIDGRAAAPLRLVEST